jgi:methyl-accepting chemotaxis protein
MIFRKSITARFIATVFVVLLIAQSAGTVAFLLYMRSSLLEELMIRMNNDAEIMTSSSSYPLLSYDYSLIDKNLDEVAKDNAITAIKILDTQNKVVREKIKAADADTSSHNPFYIKKTMQVTMPVKSGSSKIGEVVFYFSGKSINDKIQKSMIIIVLYQITALVILGFVMVYFFQKNIKRPVQEINRAIEKITNGELAATIPDLGDNEIGSIAKGVGVLELRLARIIARVNETAMNVGVAIKRVDHTYRIASEGITSQAAAIKNSIRSIQMANKAQRDVSDSIEKLLNFSTENVTSLLEMKATAEEMSSQTQRLFRSTEDSYSVVLEMSQSSKSISVHSGQALSAVEDTSASIEEISASVSEVEEHAIDSSAIADNVKEITSGEGMMSVVNAVEGMESISDQVQKSAEIIQRLGARSVDIEKVLSVIRDVTEQTNLLSLNAAILACQAGEYGKSFSVVADEIRALSERTASSTREIGGIVKTIQKDIKDAVNSVDNTKLKVEDGNTLVVKVGEALRQILNASIKSSDMTKAIKRATGEQSLGLGQVTSAINDIRKVVISVTKSTKEQENALSYLLEGVGDVKEVAELSKRSAGEQAEGARIISRNIELANERIDQINKNELNQKKVNAEIIVAMENINSIGTVTMENMEEVSNSLSTLVREIEALKQEMEVFKTS